MAEYAYTDSQGQGHLPVGDAAHARNALARFGQTFFESEAKARTAWSHIVGACKRFGIDVSDKKMPAPKIKKPSEGYKKASADMQLATFAVAISSDDAPEWIELMPAGKFSAVDGRGPFANTDPDKLIAASIARMPEVGAVIDYDHSTDLAAPEGRPAIAAGWIKELKSENGAIMARIEWTQDAAAKIKAKEYRYVSPVFEHAKDGTVERILRAALTNNPALTQLPAIAAAQREIMARKEEMSLSEMAKRLEAALPRRENETAGAHRKRLLRHVSLASDDDGDGDDDAGDEGEEAAGALKDWAGEEEKEPEHQDSVGDEATSAEDEESMARRHADEMARCASDDERTETAARHKREMDACRMSRQTAARQVKGLQVQNHNEKSRMAARQTARMEAEVIALQAQMSQFLADRSREAAQRKVDSAIRDGRLLPAQRDVMISYALSDENGFEKFIGAQPRILQTGNDGTFTGRLGEPQPGAVTFSQGQIEIFANLGLETDEQLRKCAAIREKWTLKFPRPRLMLDDSNAGAPAEVK